MKPSDRYLKIVEWSEEDQSYVGTCPGLFFGGVHGQNETEVYRELCVAVEDVIAQSLSEGRELPPSTAAKDYSGKFVVRVGEDLHKALSIHALLNEMSLNKLCVNLLRRGVRRTFRNAGSHHKIVSSK